MDNPRPKERLPEQLDRRSYTGGGFKLVKAILSVIIIAFGAMAMNYFVASAPKAKRRPPKTTAPLVRVRALQPGPQSVTVRVMGTVIPARETTLEARVAGEIVETHPDFIEGGFLREGETVVRIDDADYQLARIRAQSAVVDARYALALERGRQDVARREWSLLNGSDASAAGDADLALRKPHLEKALADLAAAEADLRQAELQLSRIRVTAPFNAILRVRHVTDGSQVAVHGPVADLVATDRYRIRVSVPVDHLDRIDIPRHRGDSGAGATVFYRDGAEIRGRVVKLLSDLETEGRMARLLIVVEDPLGLENPVSGRPPMLLGEFVRVAIEGRPVGKAYRISRAALRDNAVVWIAAANDTLDIRPVETVWRDKETVLVARGIAPGERLILSDLAAPAQGMALSIDTEPQRSGSASVAGAEGATP